MGIVNLEFDHAIQRYYLNGQWTNTTITSGTVKTGYASANVSDNYYYLDLYFRVTDNVYAYKWQVINLRNANISGITYINESQFPSSYFLTFWQITNSEDLYYPITQRDGGSVYNGCYFIDNYNDRNVGIGKILDASYVVLRLIPYRHKIEETNTYAYYFGSISNVENCVLEVTTEEIPLVPQNIYPVNVNCRNDRTINTTWTYDNPRDYTYLDQPIYYPTEATVTVTQGQTVKTFSTTESYVSCPIPANELIPGEATYKVTLTTNYGYDYDSPEQTFTVIGQTSAPEITNITQDSFPTITWNCADQAAWELLIRNNNSVVYHSDMKAGTEQSFTLPVMLEDGSYSVEMRALNIYGYYTDWGSYGFTLSPTKPTAATNLIVSTNANYTVTIDCTAPEDAGTLYVIRRRTPNDKAEIIGEYNNGFTDYYVPVNTTYEYAVRNYVTGYADTDFIDATIKCPGVVIRDGEDLSRFIPLWKNDNEEFDVISNDSRSDTLVQCLGRKYPVNEIGEWLTSTRTFTAHVSSSDMLKLNDINLNSKCVYLQNKDECIPCKMEINDAGEYNGGGRIINFTLTRIDEEIS